MACRHFPLARALSERHQIVGFVIRIVNLQDVQLFVDGVDEVDVVGEFLDH